MERQVTSLSGQCQSRDEKLRELTASLQKLQVRVDQMDDGGAGVSSLVTSVVGQRLKDLGAGGLLGSQVRLGGPRRVFSGTKVRRTQPWDLVLLFISDLKKTSISVEEGGLTVLSLRIPSKLDMHVAARGSTWDSSCSALLRRRASLESHPQPGSPGHLAEAPECSPSTDAPGRELPNKRVASRPPLVHTVHLSSPLKKKNDI